MEEREMRFRGRRDGADAGVPVSREIAEVQIGIPYVKDRWVATVSPPP